MYQFVQMLILVPLERYAPFSPWTTNRGRIRWWLQLL